ncbi:MAG TPA: tetratricopeptide repeat protein [Rhodospirillales bacterium]|nr:tetratricopeptide repeat protein [Rhodospirillales bacterium]
MNESKPRRKLAAILAADVVNFSMLMGENEDRTLKNLKACRTLTDDCISANHGRIFGSAGDSIIAEFASPVDAVIAATEFQRSLRQRNEGVPEEDQMLLRVGLNLGDVIVEGDNLYGDGVNVAARLEALAEPGGISLSGKFHEEVCRKLDMSFVSTGEKEMKNIRTPVPTYKIEISELPKLDSAASSTTLSNSMEGGKESLGKESTDGKPPAIAVLPFTNMSGDPEQDYFVDGITEDIITNLSSWRTFPVISRNSSFTYKGKSVNVKDVAEELGVRYIVEGSVRKGGNRIRITAQLINAEQDHHLWSEKWDKSLEDIFDVQDEVSTSIAAQVNPTLADYERDRIERSRPVNFSAWETYLKSLHKFNERDPSDHEDNELKEARFLCEQAIELDDSMSHAYSLLSQICVSELLQFTTEDSNRTLNDILLNAKKATELDSKNPIAAESIASYYFFSGKFEEAKQYSMRAVKLNPSYPEAQNRLGQSYVHSGEYAESEKHFRKAIELNPLDTNSIVYKDGLFFAQMGLGNYELAHELIEECILQFPNTGFYRGFRASVKGYLDKGDEAKAALDDYLKLRPNLKTKDDYKKIFVPNSSLADILIEGLVKAGWEPES